MANVRTLDLPELLAPTGETNLQAETTAEDPTYRLTISTLEAFLKANGQLAPLDVNGFLSAVNMRPFNYRGAVTANTAYNRWDIVVYRGKPILVTNPFTTGSGTPPSSAPPFLSAANYVQLLGEHEVRASDFGVSTSSSNNFSAIQAALDHAYALGGATGGGSRVLLPPGVLQYGSTLTIRAGVFLVGTGQFGTTLKLNADSNCDMIRFYRSTNGTSDANAMFSGIYDLSLDGRAELQSGAGPYHGIYQQTNPFNTAAFSDFSFDPSHIVMNVRIYRIKGDGVYIDGRSDMRLTNVKSSQCRRYGFRSSFDTHFDHCISESSGEAGFYVPYSSVQLTGCKSYKSGTGLNLAGTTSPNLGHGFFFENGSEIAAVGCDAQQNAAHGFYSKNNKAIAIQGATNAEAGYLNPGTWAGVLLEGTTKSIVDVVHGSGTNGLASAVGLTSGATGNIVRATHSQGSGSSISAIMSGSTLTGNNVMIDGISQTDKLNSHTDVNITNPSNLQGLVYDAATGKWINSNAANGTFSAGLLSDGSDGAVDLDGTNAYSGMASKTGSVYGLVKDANTTSFIIRAGVTLKTNGFRIFCQGVPEIESGALIHNSGNAGQADGTAGAISNTNAPLGGGPAGGAGQTTNGSNGSNNSTILALLGVGNSGAGGAGASGTGGNNATVSNTGAWMFKNPQAAVTTTIGFNGGVRNVGGAPSGGGGGGDGVNKGGGGGSGAGALAIFAQGLINNGAIEVRGGNGGSPAAGNCGGGGGGGGGLLLIYTITPMSGSGTTSAAGGTGGTASGTGTNGNNGSNGSVVNIVLQ
jgi:hypothetical protein